MGAGVSARYHTAIKEASDNDIRFVVSHLPKDRRNVLEQCLSGRAGCSRGEVCHDEGGPDVPSDARASADGVAVVGENEDGVDTVLALELSKQEMMFLKCLRKRAEREKQRKLEKEQRKVVLAEQKRRAMEAAFEDDVDELLRLFEQGVEPDCEDEHGTTLLSEAAGGGATDTLQMLVGEGCDVNSIGRYRRTPLWRAAYAGRADLIRILLRCGSDPREPDEQGAKPIDVASTAESKELLLCWDTSSTERIQQANRDFRKQNAKQLEKEAQQKAKRQMDELNEAVEEAYRKSQIAVGELAKSKKLLQDYRQQAVSVAEVGDAGELAELEVLLAGTEAKVKLFEAVVQEWGWKVSRAKLKLSDFEQAEKEKSEKSTGKVQGFRLEVRCETAEELAAIVEHLNADLEVKVNVTTAKGLELNKGDAIIKEFPFSHLTKREFNKAMLMQYGRDESEQSHCEEGAELGTKEMTSPFPFSLFFARGFNRIIDFKQLSDVLLKDVGDARRDDGRWPLVIDPSGRTSKGIKYLECVVFTMAELLSMETLRFRRALLTHLMHGGAVLIDLESFEFPIDVIEDQFNKVERGLYQKFIDRSVLYSYLLPRRFRTLITKELESEYRECMYMDENLQKFVLGFITSTRNPGFSFAKQFYTISVRGDADDD